MIKTFIRTFIIHYFFIYALTMIVTYLFVLIGGQRDAVPLEFFWHAALFSLAADAPLAIYLSKSELTSKQFTVRAIIHAAVLEAVLMPIGYLFGMWRGVGGGFIFFFAVIGVAAAVHLLNFINDKCVSDEINAELKRRRHGDAPNVTCSADNAEDEDGGRDHD